MVKTTISTEICMQSVPDQSKRTVILIKVMFIPVMREIKTKNKEP